MEQLHLVVPDLFLPPDNLRGIHAGLHLNCLEKLLARATHAILPATSVEAVLCESFAATAAAPVRARADGLSLHAEFCYCADPVNLQMQQSQVVLRPDVQCTAEEARQLCATLNKHFAQDGLTFTAPHAGRWYVSTAQPSDVTMTPLRTVAWRDVKPYQPHGGDALRWLRVTNEIQMLLHDHPVNVAREERGQPAINSLWLWGGGGAGSLHPTIDVVGGDDALSDSFAVAAGMARSRSIAAMLDMPGQRGLWVATSLADAWQRGDLYAWRIAAEEFEREVAQAVWHGLLRGRLRKVTLDVLQDAALHRFTLTRAASWQIWRWPRPLANYSV